MNNEIEHLKKIINNLELKNQELENKLKKYEHTLEVNMEERKKAIDKFVKQLLEDDSINSSFIPDSIEKNIYSSIVNVLIGIIEKILDSASIEFLNHQIQFKLNIKN
jgi:hypothetical protein